MASSEKSRMLSAKRRSSGKSWRTASTLQEQLRDRLRVRVTGFTRSGEHWHYNIDTLVYSAAPTSSWLNDDGQDTGARVFASSHRFEDFVALHAALLPVLPAGSLPEEFPVAKRASIVPNEDARQA